MSISKFMLSSFGVLSVVFGTLLILSPQTIVDFPSDGRQGEFLIHVLQSRGAAVVGLGAIAWVVRNEKFAPGMRVMLFAFALSNGLMAAFVALSQFTPAASASSWPLAGVHAIWAVGFSVLFIRGR